MMPGDWAVFQGRRDHHGWSLFPFVPVFSPLVPGFLMLREKATAVGRGGIRDQELVSDVGFCFLF